ncbi:hypothetical protein NTD86_13125, partial [Pseudomonas sp. 7P_10.2_Bac1]|uniref:hypothetical protein n=1 Tax=Pseudomonas sp. 7P_10.2_Bac1 TaxID=2971614 RepID=UPI0021C5D3CB
AGTPTAQNLHSASRRGGQIKSQSNGNGQIKRSQPAAARLAGCPAVDLVFAVAVDLACDLDVEGPIKPCWPSAGFA